jgi:hypothetical protein
MSGMKIFLRRWDGRTIIGGLQPIYNSGASVLHGSDNYGYETYEFYLDPDERIVSADVRAGYLIDSVAFRTSKGRVFGPYGGDGGSMKSITPPFPAPFLAYMEGRVEMTQGCTAVRHVKFVWGYY